MVVETDAGLVPGRRLTESQYRVKLNNPGTVDLNWKPGVAYVELGTPGVPHAVTEIPDLRWSDMEILREKAVTLRHDAAFPKGANVNFYTWIGENHVRVLTFERGVEDYTRACGTGCGSTAVTLWLQGRLPERSLIAENQGGTLQLTISGEKGNVTSLLLEGPAELVSVYEI